MMVCGPNTGECKHSVKTKNVFEHWRFNLQAASTQRINKSSEGDAQCYTPLAPVPIPAVSPSLTGSIRGNREVDAVRGTVHIAGLLVGASSLLAPTVGST